jgi:hypothetical protein
MFTLLVRDVNGNTLGRAECDGDLVDTYMREPTHVGSCAVESVALYNNGEGIVVTVELAEDEDA